MLVSCVRCSDSLDAVSYAAPAALGWIATNPVSAPGIHAWRCPACRGGPRPLPRDAQASDLVERPRAP